MVMNKIQKSIAMRFMHMTIVYKVKDMIEKNQELTTNDVMIEINEQALQTLCSNGITIEEIESTIEDVIDKCKEK
jgi:hypothetical protein